MRSKRLLIGRVRFRRLRIGLLVSGITSLLVVAGMGPAVARLSVRRSVVLGILIGALVTGLTSVAAVNAQAATTMKADKAYAGAQLLKMSNLPHGWQKSGQVWTGTSDDPDSSSMFTVTQFPQLFTCLGMTPPLSVVAAEASSLNFNSADQSTNVFDVADVYDNVADAKTDFPPSHNPKFANCVIQTQGSAVIGIEKSEWDPGVTFGSPTASVVKVPRYGSESGMLMVQVPVNLPASDGGGHTTDFFTALIIRQGRSTAELFIDQTDVPPSATLTRSLAQTITAKMKAPPPGNTIVTA
jgi:hypothetical protein